MESVMGEKMRRRKLLRSTFCLSTRVLGFLVTVANGFTHNLSNLSEGLDSYLLELVCPLFFRNIRELETNFSTCAGTKQET